MLSGLRGVGHGIPNGQSDIAGVGQWDLYTRILAIQPKAKTFQAKAYWGAAQGPDILRMASPGHQGRLQRGFGRSSQPTCSVGSWSRAISILVQASQKRFCTQLRL